MLLLNCKKKVYYQKYKVMSTV